MVRVRYCRRRQFRGDGDRQRCGCTDDPRGHCACSSSDRIVVVFSEPVSAGSATLAGNYAVTNAAGTAFVVNNAAFFGGRTQLF